MKLCRPDKFYMKDDIEDLKLLRTFCPELSILNDYALWMLWKDYSQDQLAATFLTVHQGHAKQFIEWYGGQCGNA